MSDEAPTNIIDIRPLLKEVEEKRPRDVYQKIADAAKKLPNPASTNPDEKATP